MNFDSHEHLRRATQYPSPHAGRHGFSNSYSVDYTERFAWFLSLVLVLLVLLSFVYNPVDTSQYVAVYSESSELPFVLASIVVFIAARNLWISLGKDIGICELAGAIAAIQWLLAPMLSYWMEIDHFKYFMYVDSDVYFSYTVPGTAIFMAGMMLPLGLARKKNKIEIVQVSTTICWSLLVVGFVASSVPRFVSVGPLAFVFFILSSLQYSAALMFLFTKGRLGWLVPVGILVISGVKATNSGMFHDAILWASMFAAYFFLKRPNRTIEKALIILVGVFIIMTIQIVKAEIRDVVWRGESNDTFTQIAYDELVTNSKFLDQSELESSVIRFNQGWIISRIMQQVPSAIPFANGETFLDATESALLPRFLAPDKKGAGGREIFFRFTGLELGESTSMGTSILGEAYGNFGAYGGCIAMFVFGLLLRLLTMHSYRIMDNFPALIFFLPMIFLHAVKAETDSVTVLNFVAKSAVLSLIIVFAISRIKGKTSST